MTHPDSVPAAAAYTVHQGDVGRDREAVLAVLRGSLGQDARMTAKYGWFYLECPAAQPLLTLLQSAVEGRWVGCCALGARAMRLCGQPLRAGLQADFAVAIGHRSLGPALLLQQALLAAAPDRFDFIYGFPNTKARTIFRRLGWEEYADLVRYGRVLRHRAYLQRRMPAFMAVVFGATLDAFDSLRQALRRRLRTAPHVGWADQVDHRMDTLWAESPGDDALVTRRDCDYLRWRFDACPLTRTRYLLISTCADGALLAWFATRTDGDTLVVCDFWSLEGTRGVAAQHLDCLIAAARAAGHAAISVEIAARPAALEGWRSRGFVERQRRPVYAMFLRGRPTGKPFAPYLTAADEDE